MGKLRPLGDAAPVAAAAAARETSMIRGAESVDCGGACVIGVSLRMGFDDGDGNIVPRVVQDVRDRAKAVDAAQLGVGAGGAEAVANRGARLDGVRADPL